MYNEAQVAQIAVIRKWMELGATRTFRKLFRFVGTVYPRVKKKWNMFCSLISLRSFCNR